MGNSEEWKLVQTQYHALFRRTIGQDTNFDLTIENFEPRSKIPLEYFQRYLTGNSMVLIQSEHDLVFHEALFSRRFTGSKIFCGKNYDAKNKDFRFSDQADYRLYQGFSPGKSFLLTQKMDRSII